MKVLFAGVKVTPWWLFYRWAKKREEESATMGARREPTEAEIDRAMVIGKWFCGWNDSTGPCPIDVTNGHWGKKLCAVFEWIAVLETDVRDFESRIAPHILRNWDRERIVRFAKHLLGDECQECQKHNGGGEGRPHAAGKEG